MENCVSDSSTRAEQHQGGKTVGGVSGRVLPEPFQVWISHSDTLVADVVGLG